MNGFLLIDKPSGRSSASCVYSLRKILKIKKIGHCGTLDPLATGVLPLCIGEATKFSNYVSDQSKEYEVEILFGLQTSTGDLEGEEIYKKPFKLSKKALMKSLKKFQGAHQQVPPMFSAIKYKGKPLYAWVRKGVYFSRQSREVRIFNIELLFCQGDKAKIRVSCSKGTYIRALIEDLGEDLSTGATVIDLRRTRVGDVTKDNLVDLESVDIEECRKALVPYDTLLRHIPEIHLDKIDTKKIRNGQLVDYNARQDIKGIVRIYADKGLFVGIGSIDSSNIVSAKRLLSNPSI
ncbi:MAG TPA: tRNA pseudouridine(55) synthase TruB [Gammaproteobacteria bacterium]|jgi:tRNA pseudouridine55 synthase|nr:tRNA pseudouridine(55) synthase TruB [Gammaproteobacteria bacterium]HIK72703.1 tRNA pseudouridine(55) synthase TruB [Gammaproteobacteria bacterium]